MLFMSHLLILLAEEDKLLSFFDFNPIIATIDISIFATNDIDTISSVINLLTLSVLLLFLLLFIL